ncbi:DUF2161 family putative PD-(D/E)XK-type phosphodiesterase [Motilimonas eburnea]|uniref:DUF2161 family putative PD-(D/E)XK-type phosphodiesterase n=1 Tax=Motilimonas eburnea TaxID=1737488 RepID=UPI001E62CF53|nr:DUF2161 family putative PD-(D/E)XK-type phosphodiesterase [Motilimonas eburnea]MCE2573119.1 hypothetical protein [Motilimonas eburnea]
MTIKRLETDLYPPIKAMLEAQGFTVKGEVKQCDVMAVRQDDILVVELKNTLNLTLILQAVERLALTDFVYIAVPADCAPLKKQQKSIIKLLRRLGLGLIVVAFVGEQAYVETLVSIGDYQPRKNTAKKQLVLNEFHQRQGDPELGGASSKGKKMTVYRQRMIRIAQYLEHHGATKAGVLAKAIDEPKAGNMLSSNLYHWFERISTGVYQLSRQGREEIQHWR